MKNSHLSLLSSLFIVPDVGRVILCDTNTYCDVMLTDFVIFVSQVLDFDRVEFFVVFKMIIAR